jgi:hypothetical protein
MFILVTNCKMKRVILIEAIVASFTTIIVVSISSFKEAYYSNISNLNASTSLVRTVSRYLNLTNSLAKFCFVVVRASTRVISATGTDYRNTNCRKNGKAISCTRRLS